jgi:hypothetical protein
VRKVEKALLACGVLYALLYAVVVDVVAASRYAGYSRLSQALSELSALGAPTRVFVTAMLPVWAALLVAFGVGVWMSARDRRALHVTGGLLMTAGIVGLLWARFPMTARADMVQAAVIPINDAGHITLTAITGLLILAMIAFAAGAFGRGFRVYSLATAAVVLISGGLTGVQATKLATGEPTPWLGFLERVSVGAWLLWLVVLALGLMIEAPAPHGAPERERSHARTFTRAASNRRA